jgi:hypothetical protein
MGVDKAFIDAAVYVKPGDEFSLGPANFGEIATYQDLAVCLYGDRMDYAVCIGIKAVHSGGRIGFTRQHHYHKKKDYP